MSEMFFPLSRYASSVRLSVTGLALDRQRGSLEAAGARETPAGFKPCRVGLNRRS